MKKLGVDVSHCQAGLDFKTAREEGVSYVIIKAGGAQDKMYQDPSFKRHYSECCKIGMNKGAYFSGKADNAAQAAKEAQYLVQLLAGRLFEYPVFYAVETNLSEITDLTEVILAFLNTVRQAGYDKAGLYASEDSMNNRMDIAAIAAQGYAVWCAKYSCKEPVLKAGVAADLWQFGKEVNNLRTSQIAGQVCGQNYCYLDFSQAECNKLQNEKSEEDCRREYIRKCYRNFLGREAAEDEVNLWLQLALGEICRGIYGSEEARIHRG